MVPVASELLRTSTQDCLESIYVGAMGDHRKGLAAAVKQQQTKGNVLLCSLMDRAAEKFRVAADVVKDSQAMCTGGHCKDKQAYRRNMQTLMSYFDERELPLWMATSLATAEGMCAIESLPAPSALDSCKPAQLTLKDCFKSKVNVVAIAKLSAILGSC